MGKIIWTKTKQVAEEKDLWFSANEKYWIGVYPPSFTSNGKWLTSTNYPKNRQWYFSKYSDAVLKARELKKGR